MLSSMYHFWGVHNLYQAKLAKLNIGEQGKVGLFIFFRFSLFVFCLSLFVICFSLFIFRFSFFVIRFSLFVFTFRFFYSFFTFRFSLFLIHLLTFKIVQSTDPIFPYHILTFKLRRLNIVFLRGLFKYECKWLHNFLHMYATTKW